MAERASGNVAETRWSVAAVARVLGIAPATLRSRGLRFLVRCTQAARESGRRPILRGPTRHLQRVLGLTGLTALFDTDPHSS